MSWLDTLEAVQSRDFSTAKAAEKEKTAREVVNLASYACAVTAVVPLPFSDALLMLPIQTGMVMTIGHIYGRKIERDSAKDILVELTALAGASFFARQGIKALLPVVGAVLTVPAAFAANWAIGRVALEYFKNPGMTREQLKVVFEQAKEEGSKIFSRERFVRFRRETDPEAPPKRASSAGRKAKKAAPKRKKRSTDKSAR